MAEARLTPTAIINEFRKNGITHLVWLPDSETNFLYDQLSREPSITLVPVCREGEALPIAAGLWIGGKKPAILIQNTGLFESGDAVRGMGIGIGLPVVMFIGYRGWTRHGPTPDSAARFTEPCLNMWGINYYLVESDADVGRISIAFDEALRESRPVAVLMGAEYAPG